jgi:type VI secretion system protein ImpA
MSDDILDLSNMLAPLTEGDGAGGDLRQDYSPSSIYQKLRDARAEARADERARDSQSADEGGLADGWRQVRSLATTAIQSHSKDFEIAAWLTEALVRQAGLAGLAAGARLMTGLLENFWDPGFPQPDEDGLDGRAAPLGGLSGSDNDGTVMQTLRRTPLFRRPSGDYLSLYQFEASSETSGLADETRREQRFAQGVLPMDTVEIEAKFDPAGLQSMAAAALDAREAWSLFQTQLDNRFGYDSPPTRRVAEVLDRMIEVARRLGVNPGTSDDGALAASDGQGIPGMVGEAQGSGAVGVPGGNPAGREQALRTLEQLAEFFKKTEPQSFLAYTLAEAARRGRMSLPELLEEVMGDEMARGAMLTALGIRPISLQE